MSEHGSDGGGVSMPAAPKAKAAPDRTLEADESGRVIMSLLQRAATMAKDDCTRAMDLAHKVASGLRATEERAREAEAAAAHFRNRATQAEAWLVRIQDEVEQIFFVKKDEEITALKPDELSRNGNGRPQWRPIAGRLSSRQG